MPASITVPGFPSGFLPPGVFLLSLFGAGGASAGARSRKHVIVANKISSALSGSAPTFAVPAGTMAANTLTFLPSADDAASLAGRGSPMHRMAAKFFEQHPTGTLYGIAVPESSSGSPVKASNTLTFVNALTGRVTLRLYVAGETVEVAFSATASSTYAIADIAEDVADAILARPDLPVTAQSSAGVTTITAKVHGTRGNQLELRAEWVRDTTVTPVTASATSSGYSTTCALGDAGGYLTSGANGSTAESIALALAALATDRYSIAVEMNDSTAVAALTAWLGTQAGVTLQYRNQAVVCSLASLGTATTASTTQNHEREQYVWHLNSPNPPEEVAAQVLAARSIGDGNVTQVGALPGEETDPNANLDGVKLKSIRVQRSADDWPTVTEMNSAMGAGLTVLVPDPARPGYAKIMSSVTTRTKAADGTANYAVLQTAVVTSIDYCADDLRASFSQTFAVYRVATNGTTITQERVTTPDNARSWIFGKLKGYEAAVSLRDVVDHEAELTVIEDSGSPGRLLANIPAEVVPGLRQLAGNVRQAA